MVLSVLDGSLDPMHQAGGGVVNTFTDLCHTEAHGSLYFLCATDKDLFTPDLFTTLSNRSDHLIFPWKT